VLDPYLIVLDVNVQHTPTDAMIVMPANIQQMVV
jgi:hypothetical protein